MLKPGEQLKEGRLCPLEFLHAGRNKDGLKEKGFAGMFAVNVLGKGGEFKRLLWNGRVFVKENLKARLVPAHKVRERFDGAVWELLLPALLGSADICVQREVFIPWWALRYIMGFETLESPFSKRTMA